MFLVTNYRIFLTRRTSCHAENHGWSRMSVMNFLFYHELSNFRINTFNHTECRGRSRIIELSNFLHTECRGRSRVFITRLVLGPTDQREVIIEFSNCFFTRRNAEGHGLSNYRIIEFFLSHGESRKVTVFCHETCPLDPLTNGR